MINIKDKLTQFVRTLTRRRDEGATGDNGSIDRELPIHTAVEAGSRQQAQPRRVATDIPMDQLDNVYSPTQTSLKAPFRVSGADHQSDQEFANGVANDRWNDEDRLTNKSGDPRIGTHGRTYEPGELRAENKEGGH